MYAADQDVVARRTKFISLYKLGGHRVIINMKGDLIVSSSLKCPSLLSTVFVIIQPWCIKDIDNMEEVRKVTEAQVRLSAGEAHSRRSVCEGGTLQRQCDPAFAHSLHD